MSTKSDLSWTPTAELLEVPPAELAEKAGDRPRMAKTEEQAAAVLSVWNKERTERARVWSKESLSLEAVGAPVLFKDSDGCTLYGHIFQPPNSPTKKEEPLPGVLFFHTGAGPHDIYLHWKASSLAGDAETFPKGCVVLIVDIISDDRGWGWDNDKTRYNSYRKEMLKDVEGKRPLLRQKIRAGIDALKSRPNVDPNRIAALGWCMGGHPILELANMAVEDGGDGYWEGLRAMATFHGVFDGILDRPMPPKLPAKDENAGTQPRRAQVLFCNGSADPFCPAQEVQAAQETLANLGYDCSRVLLQIDGVRHGFTNPAHEFHPNQKTFQYDEVGAELSWASARRLLHNTLIVQS